AAAAARWRAPRRSDGAGRARTRRTPRVRAHVAGTREAQVQEIQVIDSHTAGEPTRLVIDGGPDLGVGPLAQRVERFRQQFDAYRSAIVYEPRGCDTLVGALMCNLHRPDCNWGVIFVNHVGYIV